MNQPHEDDSARRDLANLLRFTEGLLATREKTVFDISEYPVRLIESDFLYADGSLLPGIAFGPSHDVWLTIARLQETRPPKAPVDLERWLRSNPRPAPSTPPDLLTERVVIVDAEEATLLVEAGLADQSSVAPADRQNNVDMWAVPLRPQELPSVVDALQAYVSGPWKAWASEEAPRRKAIDLYSILFKAHGQAAIEGVEIVVGIGLARWILNGRPIHVPIIEQSAELEVDTLTGTLSIVPRSIPPIPALDPFIGLGRNGATELQRDLRELLEAISRDPDRPFGPFQPSSFIGVLQRCAATLDARGMVLESDDETGPVSDALRIAPSFCLIVRARRTDVLRADIQRLISRVSDAATVLPQSALRFVVQQSDAADHISSAIDWERLVGLGGEIGLGSSRAGAGSAERPKRRDERLFFPLPANDEQEEIARRLEDTDVHGVVVQGPPGTGKTHTIANIIGHSMARGRRVLVAAHTAEALGAIREKLPPAIRDLVIAITHSDRDGLRQLEEAVSLLADRTLSLNVAEVNREIEDIAIRLHNADGEIEDIDKTLAEIARVHMTELDWRGDKVLPHVIATWAASQSDRHSWFPDSLGMSPGHRPRFSETEIAEARRLRAILGDDVIYRVDALPANSGDLPGVSALLDVHRAIRDGAAREQLEQAGGLIRPDVAGREASDVAELLEWLGRLAAWRECAVNQAGLLDMWDRLCSGRAETTSEIAMFKVAATLAGTGESLALMALELDEPSEPHTLTQPLANLAAGRRAFGIIGGFGKNPARTAIEAAKIASERPRSIDDWQKLADLHAWRGEVRGFVARWNAMADQRGFERLSENLNESRKGLEKLGHLAGQLVTLAHDVQQQIVRLQSMLPYGIDARRSIMRADVSLAIASLQAALADAGLTHAKQLRDQLRVAAKAWGGPLAQSLRQIAEGLGSPDVEDAEAASLWRTVLDEAARVTGLRNDLSELDKIASAVAASGAPAWALSIRSDPPDRTSVVLPEDWLDAWDFARARGFLAGLVDRTRIDTLTRRRAELVGQREHHFLRKIELLTYLGLRTRLTERVQGALRQFMAALGKMPKTAGAQTAPHWRRVMRDNIAVAAPAIPCWIMPEWRVAEQLPPELGQFDLVIIDEASQSNITALPTVLRGRKILVVGDDKQVSPVAIGIENADISRLRAVHVKGQPLADHFDPATSLYELAGMMFPGKVTVLREHFRCVEPIIRFSSRFYDKRILPLRFPKPSERMDPPLVDIFVEDGVRVRDTNPREVSVIVDEIAGFIDDDRYHRHGNRTIGVISLHASKQAQAVYDALIERIGPEAMSTHNVMCGDAATFQGQERDIVFLSMVHDERSATKQSSKLYEQRYNVALSRARDRMVLVRSVTSSMLKEGDIKLGVLRHFQKPEAGGRIGQSLDVLDACESRFEVEFGRRLLQEGFRVRTQVPAGGYRIDFVVEGDNDARLAIELDGDAHHGPERWAQDTKRQKALERVGWIFWRCWASEWAADQEGVFNNLLCRLEQLGIRPTGSHLAPDQLSVEHRRVGARADILHTTDAVEAVAVAVPRNGRSMTTAAAEQREGVMVGDRVSVRFADGRPGVRTVQIVSDGSANGRDRVSVGSPLGMAVIGLGVEDEADFETGERTRTIVLERIEKCSDSPTDFVGPQSMLGLAETAPLS